MTLLLHGEAGGLDELLIALVAFAVLWIAVKLAGRKPATDEDDDAATHASAVSIDEDLKQDPAPPATKLG